MDVFEFECEYQPASFYRSCLDLVFFTGAKYYVNVRIKRVNLKSVEAKVTLEFNE